jgi:hypothetical protein
MEKRRELVYSRRFYVVRISVCSMAVIMGVGFMAGMVMLMWLEFDGLVCVPMAMFVVPMIVGMVMLVGMRVLMLMPVGMGVLLVPMHVGMRVFVLMSMLVFVAMVVLAFHQNSP